MTTYNQIGRDPPEFLFQGTPLEIKDVIFKYEKVHAETDVLEYF